MASLLGAWNAALIGLALGIGIHVGVSEYSGYPNAGDAGLPLFVATTGASILVGVLFRKAEDALAKYLVAGMAIAIAQFIGWLIVAEETTFIVLGLFLTPVEGLYCWGVAWASGWALTRSST